MSETADNGGTTITPTTSTSTVLFPPSTPTTTSSSPIPLPPSSPVSHLLLLQEAGWNPNRNPVGEEVPESVYYAVASLLTVGCLLGAFFNVATLVVYCKTKTLRTPTNSFVAALCTCDALMCMVGMPITAGYAWSRTWIGSRWVCVLDGFAVYMGGLSSLYLLAAVSVDRYVVIVRPLQSSSLVTRRTVALGLGTCFLLGLFWTVMPVLGWNRYVLEGIGVACSVSWHTGGGSEAGDTSYIVAIFIFCYLLPLAVMAFCYAKIYLAIRNMARSSPWGADSVVARNNYRLERKMLKTIIVMIAAFLVSWTPYTVVGLVETFTGERIFGPVLETFPAIFAKMSSVWDPLIYFTTNLQFRRAFFEMCPCCESLLGLCATGDVSAEGSQTAMNPESCAAMDAAEAQRVGKAHTSSDTPPPKASASVVRHDSVTLEIKVGSETRRGLGCDGGGEPGGGRRGTVSNAVEDLPPVD